MFPRRSSLRHKQYPLVPTSLALGDDCLCGFGFSGGNSGLMISHNSSVSSGFAIPKYP